MKKLNITTGNIVNLHLALTRFNEPFPIELAIGVAVNLVSTLGTRTALSPVINDDGTVDVTVPAVEKPGYYGIEVRGILNEQPWRTYTGGILHYTYVTVPGCTEATLDGDTYDITMVVQMNAPAAPLTQVQSDWAEEDDTLPAFILNKPDVRSVWDMKIPQNPAAEERGYVPTVGSVADTLEGVEESLQGKQDKLDFAPPIVNDNGIPSIVETTTGNFNRIDDVATAEGDGWHNVQKKDRTLPTIAAIEAQGYLTEQVQADWNVTDSSLPSYIKHKPNVKHINVSDIDNMTVANGLFIVNGGSGGIIVTIKHYVGGADQFWLDAEHGYIRTRKMSGGTWGAWSDNLYYAKPATGIPVTDLAQAVQTSLGLADSALQSQEQADWNETDNTKPSFIKNKPALKEIDVAMSFPNYNVWKTEPVRIPNIMPTLGPMLITNTVILRFQDSTTLMTMYAHGLVYLVGNLPFGDSATSSMPVAFYLTNSGNDAILTYKPVALAEFADDATHRTVSDAEKTAWNGKQDALLFSEQAYGRGRFVTDSSGTHFEVFLVTDRGTEIENIVQGSDGWDHAGDTVSIPTISAIESQGYLREHQDISGKEDKMAISTPAGTAIAAVAGTYYSFAANVDTLAVTLPTMTDASKVASVVLYLTTGTAPAITFDSSHPVVYQDGFALEASKTYEVNCLYNGAAWVLMAAEINTGS